MLDRHPLNSSELSLYIHVPFCRQKCDYCAFYSVVPGTEALDRYLQELLAGLEVLCRDYPGYAVKTVYVGGGTPSVLGPRRLDRLFQALSDDLPHDGGREELSLELNPEDLSPDLLRALQASPLTRLSLGVQSVNPKTLRTIGRGRPGGGTAAADAARSALERLCRDWPGTLSVDLIAAVPGSSPEEAREDVRTVAVSEVDHLSIYALTLEPGTPLHRRICGVRGTSAGGEMTDPATDSWLAAVEEAGARGYRRYEVSNLAKPGAECRHNRRFWEGRPYLGLGPAAVSTLWSSGRPGALRWTRGRRPGELAETERLGYPELLLEYLMLRLRTREGLDMASFAGIFGEQPRRELEAASTGARAAGLLRLEGAVPGRLRASDRGYRYLDAVIGGLADGLSLTEACPDDSVKRLPVE